MIGAHAGRFGITGEEDKAGKGSGMARNPFGELVRGHSSVES